MSERLDVKPAKEVEQYLARHRSLLRGEPKETRELFEKVIAEGRKGNFHDFIMDVRQKDSFGRALAMHNAGVATSMKIAGVDISQWLDYDNEETEFFIDRRRADDLWAELEHGLCCLESCFSCSDIYRSVNKDANRILQMKKSIRTGQIKVPDNPVTPAESPFFPTYVKTVAHLKKKEGRLQWSPIDAFAYWPTIHAILREFTGQGEAAKKEYSVGLWRRDPLRDAFLGNLSECCIAIGGQESYPAPNLRLYDVYYKRYPAGIFEFLADVGIQVAEILLNRKTIGACWLFLSKNENGRADLVADSIDISAELAGTRPEKKAIRACTLRFLRKYAEAIGAERAFIGKTGPMMDESNPRPIMIDFETRGLPVVKLAQPINKIGGYFRNRAYFLESRHGVEAFLVK